MATEAVPVCLASMGCLCAGHARGNDASAACDTREVAPAEDDNDSDGSMWCADCESVALNMVCESCASNQVADRIREYADRRKMLGFMSPEVFAAFGEFIDELEGR